MKTKTPCQYRLLNALSKCDDNELVVSSTQYKNIFPYPFDMFAQTLTCLLVETVGLIDRPENH